MTASATDPFGAFVPGLRHTLAPTAPGPLDGLRFAVKDLIDVAGAVTGGGNPSWAAGQQPARRSAPIVDALLRAGATMVGKTITDELAFSLEGANAHYGTPINPAAPECLPGGSSSGSASAVAASLVDFALGTDTGGSVRIPASFCGLYGLRPTHGRIPLDGVLPFAPSYDTIGLMARDADVLERVGAVVFGESEEAPVERFLFATDAFALADPAVSESLSSAIAARIGSIDRVQIFEGREASWREAYRVLQGAEIWANLGEWITRTKPRFGTSIAERFAGAATINPEDVARWAPFREDAAASLDTLLPPGTVLVLPTSPTAALPCDASGAIIGDFYGRALTLTAIAGHAGLPQLTMPLAHVDGRPVGLSLVGRRGADRALLRIAAQHAGSRHPC